MKTVAVEAKVKTKTEKKPKGYKDYALEEELNDVVQVEMEAQDDDIEAILIELKMNRHLARAAVHTELTVPLESFFGPTKRYWMSRRAVTVELPCVAKLEGVERAIDIATDIGEGRINVWLEQLQKDADS
jgi:rubrerythrin